MDNQSFINPFEQGDGSGDGGSNADGGGTEASETGEDFRFPDIPFAHEDPDDPVGVAGLLRKAQDLLVGKLAAPEHWEDVEDHISRIHPRLGVPRSLGLAYCNLGLVLRRMPELAALLDERPFLPMAHLNVIVRSVYPLRDEVLPAVERELLEFLAPKKPGQAMCGPRALGNHLRRSIEAHDPDMRPKDPDEPPPPRPPTEELDIDERDAEFTALTAVLPADQAREVVLIIDAIARKEDCTRPQALVRAVQGTATVGVTVNIYRDVWGGPAWMAGAGWLDRTATEDWCSRITGVRLASNGSAEGYAPTEAMTAFLEGRDGTCRFPGCEHPAHKCDKDHIRPYDRDDPAAGGSTDTANMHCLCRRHHNLKTAGLWDVEAHPDGSEVWTSADRRHRYTTMPEGPLARFGRRTFAQRITRTARTLREHNERRREAIAQERAAVAAARAEALARLEALTDGQRAEVIDRARNDPEFADWLREAAFGEEDRRRREGDPPPF